MLGGQGSGVLAVEQIAHSAAALGVGFALVAKLFGRLARARSGGWLWLLFFTALRAAVGKAGFAGTQLELRTADGAGFDGEGHTGFHDNTGGVVDRRGCECGIYFDKEDDGTFSDRVGMCGCRPVHLTRHSHVPTIRAGGIAAYMRQFLIAFT